MDSARFLSKQSWQIEFNLNVLETNQACFTRWQQYSRFSEWRIIFAHSKLSNFGLSKKKLKARCPFMPLLFKMVVLLVSQCFPAFGILIARLRFFTLLPQLLEHGVQRPHSSVTHSLDELDTKKDTKRTPKKMPQKNATKNATKML